MRIRCRIREKSQELEENQKENQNDFMMKSGILACQYEIFKTAEPLNHSPRIINIDFNIIIIYYLGYAHAPRWTLLGLIS